MNHLEEQEQITLLHWAAFQRIRIPGVREKLPLSEFIIAIPNGAHLAGNEKQRGMQMARLKRLGLKPGASDLLVALARGEWHGLWLEMKRPRHTFDGGAAIARAVREDQRTFGELMQRVGYRHAVAYGFEEAQSIVESYVEGRDVLLTGVASGT